MSVHHLPRTIDRSESAAECGSRSDDIDWITGKVRAGELDEHAGRFVAVWNRQVLAFGDDGMELRSAVCKAHGVSPERLLIYYLPDGTE